MHLKKLQLLNQRQWFENRRSYTVGMISIAVLLLFLFLITWHFKESFFGDVNRGIFLIGLFVGGGLFASSLLRDIRKPSRGIWLIGLPASSAEKISIAILYALILYPIFFVGAFVLMEKIFLLLVASAHNEATGTDLLKNNFYYFFFTFLNTQSLFLMGCLVFRKMSFIKTLILIITGFAITNQVNSQVLILVTGEKALNGGTVFGYFQFVFEGDNVYVNLPPTVDKIVSAFFNFMLPVFLSCINYLKLKEAEL